jgi:hypothetical protein
LYLQHLYSGIDLASFILSMNDDILIRRSETSGGPTRLASLDRRAFQSGPAFADHIRAASAAASGPPSAFESVIAPILKAGSSVKQGLNPMKYGIMQSTLRDYDPKGVIARNVSDLNEDKARQIYRRIWDRSGSGRLPDALAATHFKTYIRRPKTAIETLKQAGGDAATYLKVLAGAKQNTMPATAGTTQQYARFAVPVSPPPASLPPTVQPYAPEVLPAEQPAQVSASAKPHMDIFAPSAVKSPARGEPAPVRLENVPPATQTVIARLGENNVDLTIGSRAIYKKMAEQLGLQAADPSRGRNSSSIGSGVVVSIRIPL